MGGTIPSNMRIFLFLISLLAGIAPAAAEDPRLLVVGDSLSASYGIPAERGWVNLLQQRLREQGLAYEVVNASISGDTTRGGLARLPRALSVHQPRLVIIELGGNDGLRGVAPQEMERNLVQMVRLSQQAGARVLLLGMRLPPNYGPVFTQRFHAVFHTVADQTGVPLVPFFLEGVATEPALMQDDGIHPTAAAQQRMLENAWPALNGLLNAGD
jgi:acyl-CoA thioesterase-1